jgi:hypothetical protein
MPMRCSGAAETLEDRRLGVHLRATPENEGSEGNRSKQEREKDRERERQREREREKERERELTLFRGS